MAEESDLEIEETGGSKKKLIIIIAAVVVVLGAVAGYFLFAGSDDAPESLAEETTEQQEQASQENAAQTGSALYVAMPRPFVFNVPGASRDRIVQIKVQLLVRGDVNEEVAKKHIPLIEGTLLSVFSTTTADELSTSAGKETLRLGALDKVQAAMESVEGSKVVERVLFTGFVMQ
ncbi:MULTISPECIES: flagellar basal body-associated protein FliL [Pseudoalteromonas]|uniref:Flagellar protein FliL n=1 Tax=Pseudoalteromonas rubra TaxID=43658 RepID=A0A5S3UX71_9GAMM|nr:MULTISPECIES: flagellar basal body-associated protein FliL [Pseudoalteromonas]KAF7787087.1 flagellar FliL protein [Pseudoalteromonas rubra]MCG7563565.1 flagellar basal body-associated protein FliL [Pseudoalteromonas sp. McH1-42]MEC4089502.1 flagellar basal body-associated protein FliL [Pseudoalteromonas rubra]QPB82672.1 flagellar basal body-associated protein FliL [Pseudoalteromonas rubra]